MTDSVVEVDAVVVGMGPGGEAVATRLADAGLDVVGVESRLVGGECPYYACVPTKMMIRAANTLVEGRRINDLAGSARVEADWGRVAARIRAEATDDWDDTVAVKRFEDHGGRLVRGFGKITAPGEVTVSHDGAADQVFRARRAIVLNPGTDPAVPPLPGLAGTPYWTNREAVATETVPSSLVVLGGGPVAVEFGQVFRRFGARVTIVQRGPRLLTADEPEAGELLAAVFDAEGIDVRTGATVESVSHDGEFALHLTGGETITGAQLLVATGRHTDLARLGVGAVGIDESGRSIPADAHLRAAPGVWVVGDVAGHGAYTHVSMYHAPIVVADILGEQWPGADYRAVSRVTFTDPEIGAAGLTEAAARKQGIRVRVGTGQIPESPRGWIHKTGNEGFIKLVEDADRGVLVGATSVGPTGGEVLSALVVAIHGEVPTERLRHMIYAYPTFHRAIEQALDDLG